MPGIRTIKAGTVKVLSFTVVIKNYAYRAIGLIGFILPDPDVKRKIMGRNMTYSPEHLLTSQIEFTVRIAACGGRINK